MNHNCGEFPGISVIGQINLNSIMDVSGSECLNESNGHTYKKVLTSSSQYLESDCDEHAINEWMNE